MANLVQRISARREPERTISPLNFSDFVQYFNYGGLAYQYGIQQTMPGRPVEEITPDFSGLCNLAYKRNGIVFAVILARMLLFSEARFQFQQLVKGRPGDLFGTEALRLLETPEPGKTTSWLLARAEQDVSLAGNFFATNHWKGRIKRLRPDWMSILLGSYENPDVAAYDPNAEVVGYLYHPGGWAMGNDPVALMPEEVAHYAPIADPDAFYRGMSWLMPIVQEIQADQASTDLKQSYMSNSATPNTIVTLAENDPDKFNRWVEKFREDHEGAANAFRTLFLGAGANATVIGSNLQEVDFRRVTGGTETRIAAAGGVPPMIVGLSEGLEAVTYNTYGQARRRFADLTVRPLWNSVCGALANIVAVPSGARLWYDDQGISFLQEDQKDAADIQFVQAQSARQLVDGGWDPDSVVAFLSTNDINQLKHSGLPSVQLQKGQSNAQPTDTASSGTSTSPGSTTTPNGQPALPK